MSLYKHGEEKIVEDEKTEQQARDDGYMWWPDDLTRTATKSIPTEQSTPEQPSGAKKKQRK